MKPPEKVQFHQAGSFLAWLASGPESIDLVDVDVVQAWGLVALGALARRELPAPLRLTLPDTPSGRFARALGLHDVVAGRPTTVDEEPGRTVAIRRFAGLAAAQDAAESVASLMVPAPDLADTRQTIRYVLSELLRNVVQHSGDALGGVVAAQIMHAGRGGYEREVIQIAVADVGMGIAASLSGIHPDAADPRVAIERCLWPHVSGAFELGLTGNRENAGVGLFFVSEMAKLAAGRFLIASRGANLMLVGDEEAGDPTIDIQSSGFPGTLVAFELGVGEVKDYDELMRRILQRASARTPQRAAHRWLKHEQPPEGAPILFVRMRAEDTSAAMAFAQSLEAKLVARQPVALDFRTLEFCTQSFVHALLYEPLRLAWALRIPIYIVNARPAVRSTLSFLEQYALGG